MTYYPDLSPYVYGPQDRPMLNVGWLAAGHPFVTGVSDESLLQAILMLCAEPRNLMRGLQNCHFCDLDSPIRVPASVDKGYVSLGTGEIHVRGESDITYAAPSLIYHYLQAHRYLPPAEFLAAVRRTARNRDQASERPLVGGAADEV